MAQAVNCEYVCAAIDASGKAAITVTPVPGTEKMCANMEYLLKIIDMANGDETSYGYGDYATKQVADTVAVLQAVEQLVPGEA